MKKFLAVLLTICIVFGCFSSLTLTEADAQLVFRDVKASAYYYSAVEWAVQNGVTSGVSATSFAPNNKCTRGQVVSFLYRASGGTPVNTANPFVDVKSSKFYYQPVLWAVSKGITSGTSKTTFSPQSYCTRAEVVSFLWRVAGCPSTTGVSNPFKDVPAKKWYTNAVLWAVQNGITGGTTSVTFEPNTVCTRAQIVSFLQRFYAPLAVTPVLKVINKQTETYIRDTAVSDIAQLKSNEYLSFAFNIKNTRTIPYKVNSMYATINGGQQLHWGAFTLGAGQGTGCNIYYVNMQHYQKSGSYTVSLYVNNAVVATKTFVVVNSAYADVSNYWSSVFPVPTAQQIAAYKNPRNLRSPYIAGWYVQDDTVRFTEYSIDFKSDHSPIGTYCCLGQWFLDTSVLRGTYTNVPDTSLAYGGFQNTDVAGANKRSIMSFWDINVKDKAGNPVTIRPKIVYPTNTNADEFGNEGTGARYTSHFEWEESHWYRMMIQCSTDPKTGNTLVTQWICDLETMVWTKICTYDTLLKGTCFKGNIALFLENYLTQFAGQVRSMEVRNARILNASTGTWQSLDQLYVMPNATGDIFEYEGSYAYGARADRFWMITSGVGGDWEHNGMGQKDEWFTTNHTETGRPY